MIRQAMQMTSEMGYRPAQSSRPQKVGPRPNPSEEDLSRTGELVVGLQGQVEVLTAAIRALEQQIPSQLVDIQAAADFLSVSVRTVRRMIARREIPYRRVGKVIRFDLKGLRPPEIG